MRKRKAKTTPDTGPCKCGVETWPGREHPGVGRKPLTVRMCPTCAAEHLRAKRIEKDRKRYRRLKAEAERRKQRQPKPPAKVIEAFAVVPRAAKPEPPLLHGHDESTPVLGYMPPEAIASPEAPKVVPFARPLLSTYQSCLLCWKKHRRDSDYCCDEHEAQAAVPSGNDLRVASIAYTSTRR